MSDNADLISALEHTIVLAGQLSDPFKRKVILSRLNNCRSMLDIPDTTDFKTSTVVSAPPPAPSPPLTPTTTPKPVQRANWPDAARSAALLAIPGDKGVGDVLDRKRRDPVNGAFWLKQMVSLADCKTCVGNLRGILNAKYQI